MNVFALRAAELTEDRPELAAAVTPLLNARVAIEQQIADLDRKVMKLARNNAQVRHFMTAPGIGPVTALCFLATIDDPRRFRRSRSVGAYVGLTTRRFAYGEIDWTGRISKCGDKMLRSYLYEAANVLLTRVAKWSALKAWGIRLAKRSGLRKAKVAVARKRVQEEADRLGDADIAQFRTERKEVIVLDPERGVRYSTDASGGATVSSDFRSAAMAYRHAIAPATTINADPRR
jgi:hypothetical protein